MSIDYLKLAWNNIRYRKLRSWLTIIGIIIGVAAIVALISVSNGMENAITEQVEQFGADTITITPQGFSGPTGGGSSTEFEDSDVRVIESVPGVKHVLPIITGTAEIEFHKEKIYAMIFAYDASSNVQDIWTEAGFEIDKGRFPEEGEGKVAGLGYLVAYDTFEDSVHVKNRILINGERFKVVGIAKEIGNSQDDGAIFMPIETAQELLDQDYYNMIMVVAQEGVDVEVVAEKIERKLKRHRDLEDFQVLTFAEILDIIGNILGIIQLVLVGIAGISLLVGAVGIMNTMYTSVLERIKDIGIMKSIGATNKAILALFLTESAIIGMGGGVMGAIAGTGMAQAIGFAAAGMALPFPLKIVIEWDLIIFAILFALFIGMLAGYLPARKAAKMNPVDSLRYE